MRFQPWRRGETETRIGQLYDERNLGQTPVDIEHVHDLLARPLVRYHQRKPRGAADSWMSATAYALFRRPHSHQDLPLEAQRQAIRTMQGARLPDRPGVRG